MMPHKISRSKIELFSDCPRCFYLDKVKGIKHPPGYPFTLNNAVDRLLKSEFDQYRVNGQPHPLVAAAGLRLTPLQHPELANWRNNKKGVNALYRGATFYGIPDDVWTDEQGVLYVADYKATANSTGPVTALGNQEHHKKYQRQLEFYQWLLAQNGFTVSSTAYLVYATGKSALPRFDAQLQFDMHLVPVEGDRSWIEGVLNNALDCLHQPGPPAANENCKYCAYVKDAADV